jgi:hypothetical protein
MLLGLRLALMVVTYQQMLNESIDKPEMNYDHELFYKIGLREKALCIQL